MKMSEYCEYDERDFDDEDDRPAEIKIGYHPVKVIDEDGDTTTRYKFGEYEV